MGPSPPFYAVVRFASIDIRVVRPADLRAFRFLNGIQANDRIEANDSAQR